MKNVSYLGERLPDGRCEVVVFGDGPTIPLPKVAAPWQDYYSTDGSIDDASGVTLLAVSMLAHALRDLREAIKSSEDFAVEILHPIKFDRWIIHRESIWDWWLGCELRRPMVAAMRAAKGGSQ